MALSAVQPTLVGRETRCVGRLVPRSRELALYVHQQSPQAAERDVGKLDRRSLTDTERGGRAEKRGDGLKPFLWHPRVCGRSLAARPLLILAEQGQPRGVADAHGPTGGGSGR